MIYQSYNQGHLIVQPGSSDHTTLVVRSDDPGQKPKYSYDKN